MDINSFKEIDMSVVTPCLEGGDGIVELGGEAG